MYTYCLYCEAGKSKYVAEMFMALLDCKAIVPKQIQHTRSNGREVNRIHDLLPGYLFLYSETPINLPIFLWMPGVIRGLRNSGGEYVLQEADEAFALFLLEKKGIVGKTSVTAKEGRLEISPDSFRGMDVSILRVDRRNSRMQIEIRFLRQKIRTWVEFEIIQASIEQKDHNN